MQSSLSYVASLFPFPSHPAPLSASARRQPLMGVNRPSSIGSRVDVTHFTFFLIHPLMRGQLQIACLFCHQSSGGIEGENPSHEALLSLATNWMPVSQNQGMQSACQLDHKGWD